MDGYRGLQQPTIIIRGTDIPDYTIPATKLQNGVAQISSKITASGSLSLAQCGLIEIDATAGAITLTLPLAVSSYTAIYHFVRVDGTGNSVSIISQGSDTFDTAGATSITLNGVGTRNSATSNGLTRWYSTPLVTTTGIGVSQSWHNMLSPTVQRSLGYGYYNSHGVPIQVSVSCGGNRTNPNLVIDGVLISQGYTDAGSDFTLNTVAGIVPPGVGYYVTSGGGGLYSWAELY